MASSLAMNLRKFGVGDVQNVKLTVDCFSVGLDVQSWCRDLIVFIKKPWNNYRSVIYSYACGENVNARRTSKHKAIKEAALMCRNKTGTLLRAERWRELKAALDEYARSFTETP